MMALVLGDENRPKPAPITTRAPRMYDTFPAGRIAAIPARAARPAAVIAMPIEATTRGSIRSDSQPAAGETIACIAGCAISTAPACAGVIPRTYWRWRLKRNALG